MNNSNSSEISQSDINSTYQKLIHSFYELYPDKKDKIKINEVEMQSFITTFCDRLREKPQYFSLLLKRDGKMFKGLNITLLPKLKMEVVLNITEGSDDNKKRIINSMWDTIYLLYLLGESDNKDPDRIKMSKIAFALDNSLPEGGTSKQFKMNDEINETNKPALFNATGDIKMDDVQKILGSVNFEDSKEMFKNLKMNPQDIQQMLGSLQNENFNKEDVKGIFDKVMSNPNMADNMKNIMKSIGINGSPEDVLKPTENSNKFVKNILDDIKNKFKLNTSDGSEKIDSKQFVEQLMSVGNTIGDSYSKKLGSGELSINDIIGAVASMATNPDEETISDLTNSLQLDKLNLPEVLDELKGQLSGKIPPELMNTFGSLNGESLKNMNIGSLIGSMMSGQKNETITELTPEQKKELEKYYEDLKL